MTPTKKFENERKHMDLIFEVLEIIWQVIWRFAATIFSVIWESLPEILEIRKIVGYFTPAGMIALHLGVPTFIIGGAIWIGKKLIKGLC